MTFVPLGQVLAVAGDGRRTIAVDRGRRIPLSQLRADVAANRARLGTTPARRALLVAAEAYEFLVGLLALVHARCDIVLPPNPQPGTISAMGDTIDLVVADRPIAGVESHLLAPGAGADTLEPDTATDVSATRIDVFTSGSSGEPKRIGKTLGMIEAEAAMLERMWGTEAGTGIVCGTVAHQHAYGLPFRLLWPLCTGRVFSSQRHHIWGGLLDELAGPGVIVTSPAHLTRLDEIAPLARSRQPRLVFTAGAPLPVEAASEAARIFGAPPVEIFGSTDTGIVGWRRGPASRDMWTAFPGVAIEPNADLSTTVTGPFSPGRCALGDHVELADDGRFRLLGRVDRIVKIEANRVSLPELEQQIASLPVVAEAAVAPIHEARSFLGAVVVLSTHGRAELVRLGKFRFERKLRRLLADRQELVVLPRRWRFVDALPIDHMGKRRVADLLQLLAAEAER